MSRIYSFDEIRNFRDFGQYTTPRGDKIASGKLFRSAHFSAASEQDLEKIAALDIGLIVDLRHLPERERQPNRWPDIKPAKTFAYPDPEDSDSYKVAPHEAFMKERLETADDARNYMNQSYKARPSDPGFRRIFSDTLKHMADTGEGIVIHCAAGKDRTGTLAAVIQGALGVDRDTIMDDFMLTMEAVDVESYLEPAAKMMTQRFGRPFSPDALRPMFGVEPSYLENALASIGNMDAYISDVLGISSQDREKIHEKYLA